MSAPSNRQIFQSESPKKWLRIQWTGRLLLFLFGILIFIALYTISKEIQPTLPQLKDKNEQYKKILNPAVPITFENSLNKNYHDFKDYFTKTRKQNSQILKLGAKLNLSQKIRAGFYVEWDPQSFYSLKANITKMNMVIPEWFTIDVENDTIRTTVDRRALILIKKNKVPIVPMLTNNNPDLKNFDGNLLHKVLVNPAKRKKIIKDLVAKLEAYQFQGINIDFEEINEGTDQSLINFQKEIYTALHAKNLLVTQDVIPQNQDYNYSELSKFNDYLFVMAYDQNDDHSSPGPISEQKWIEKSLSDIAKKIPAKKLVLALAAYGYDWPKQSVAANVTYQEALNLVKENPEAKIIFDPATYNLNFHYLDDNNIEHVVFFTDAITNFNTIRFADEYGTAGVALWRLGSEDSRLWTFYNRNLSMDSLKKKPFKYSLLKSVGQATAVDYIGDGEILDVLRNPSNGNIALKVDTINQLISGQDYIQLPSGYVVRRYGFKEKKIVLTFDDGPDPRYTPAILDILAKEKVPATFFLIGINAENNIPIVKRIYDEGYEIGNHTFTHPNMALVGTYRAKLEMSSTRVLIESITGHSTVMFRAPYNADAEPETLQEIVPVALSKAENYYTIGEAIDPEDWEENISAEEILNRVKKLEDKTRNIILLHDSGGKTRWETVKALPKIIAFFKSKGYTFTTIADLLNKTRAEVMPRIPNGWDYYLVKTNYVLASIGYFGGQIIFGLFLVAIILGLSKILFLGTMALYQRRQVKRESFEKTLIFPLVDIIVPAYNEEINAVKTINNLLQTDYPNFRIIFIDDGSLDNTFSLIHSTFLGNPKVLVFSKPNGGKASALNFGIGKSEAEYVVCIDADTQLKKDAVRLLMRYFSNIEVGAVAGNVKVGNENTILTKWQSIEYITSQNFDRMAFDSMNCISVVPGAIGAFRKEAINKAGGFTSDTLAEDCDLTIRILRLGYEVRNCASAIAITEAPETLNMFLKQRFRWSFGIIQSFWKHRDACFNPRYKALGWVALPNILIFQIFFPLVAPLADLFMILGILWGNGSQIFGYYLLFMFVDAFVASMAFIFEKEDLRKIAWLIPQRFVYRQLMYYILFKSLRRALKGEIQHWGTLKRTGNVGELVS